MCGRFSGKCVHRISRLSGASMAAQDEGDPWSREVGVAVKGKPSLKPNR